MNIMRAFLSECAEDPLFGDALIEGLGENDIRWRALHNICQSMAKHDFRYARIIFERDYRALEGFLRREFLHPDGFDNVIASELARLARAKIIKHQLALMFPSFQKYWTPPAYEANEMTLITYIDENYTPGFLPPGALLEISKNGTIYVNVYSEEGERVQTLRAGNHAPVNEYPFLLDINAGQDKEVQCEA